MDKEPKLVPEKIPKSFEILEFGKQKIEELERLKQEIEDLPKRLYEQITLEKNGKLDRLILFGMVPNFFDEDIKRARKIYVPDKKLKILKKILEEANVDTRVVGLGDIKERELDPKTRITEKGEGIAKENIALITNIISAGEGDLIRIVPSTNDKQRNFSLNYLSENLAQSGSIIEYINTPSLGDSEDPILIDVHTPIGSFSFEKK
jgi:hypothetical protein